MRRVSVLLLVGMLALAVPARQDEDSVRLRTVDARGRPVPKVKIFSVLNNIEGMAVKLEGATNKRGALLLDEPSNGYLGISPNGSVASAIHSKRLVFSKDASLTLQAVDEHGRPLRDVETSLLPPASRAELKSYGELQLPSGLEDDGYGRHLSRTTDGKGYVRFSKLSSGSRFGVLVTTRDANILFAGSVRTGKTYRVLVANDFEIAGHVYRGDTSHPIPGAELDIIKNNFSSVGRPPDTWRSVNCDAKGAYRMSNLPNYDLGIRLSSSNVKKVFYRVNSGAWIDTGGSHPEYDSRHDLKKAVNRRIKVDFLLKS